MKTISSIRALFLVILLMSSSYLFAEAGFYEVNANSLKVRLDPSIDAHVVRNLSKKQKVIVFESVNGWGRISKQFEFEGKPYLVAEWVSMEYLTLLKKHSQKTQKSVTDKQQDSDRNKRIQRQFHPWDGSHINLEKLIEHNLKDPDSYEHIETLYSDKGSYLIVNLRYRARNGFGGMTISHVKAKVSLTGEILEILDQG